MRRSAPALACLLGLATPAFAADPSIAIKDAWAPAAGKGADTTLFMTIDNGGAEDALVRIRCDAANFTELRTIDKGEGFPSSRPVKAIPIAAQGRTALTSEGFNVRLLQLTGPLAPGETFDCALTLRGGGRHKIAVAVRPAETPE